MMYSISILSTNYESMPVEIKCISRLLLNSSNKTLVEYYVKWILFKVWILSFLHLNKKSNLATYFKNKGKYLALSYHISNVTGCDHKDTKITGTFYKFITFEYKSNTTDIYYPSKSF